MRISCLEESPCFQCGCKKRCDKKVQKNPVLQDLANEFFFDKDKDYNDCSLWISLNAPDLVDES